MGPASEIPKNSSQRRFQYLAVARLGFPGSGLDARLSAGPERRGSG
jgi:hypothetical protein